MKKEYLFLFTLLMVTILFECKGSDDEPVFTVDIAEGFKRSVINGAVSYDQAKKMMKKDLEITIGDIEEHSTFRVLAVVSDVPKGKMFTLALLKKKQLPDAGAVVKKRDFVSAPRILKCVTSIIPSGNLHCLSMVRKELDTSYFCSDGERRLMCQNVIAIDLRNTRVKWNFEDTTFEGRFPNCSRVLSNQ